jgi:transposase
MPKAHITIPLDIPNVEVLKIETTDKNEYIITIRSTRKRVRCRVCGSVLRKSHGHDDWITVQHLPILGHPVYLRFRSRRFECDCEGNPTTTEQLEWRDKHSPHSKAYDDHILLQLVNATVQDVHIKEGLSYAAVEGVIERRLMSEVDWSQYEVLGVLGLDEVALKKGRNDYVTLVTARLWDGRVAILGVLPGREKQTVKTFLTSIPARLQATVHTVCTDMYAGYTEAAREVFPRALLVIDRFHVAKHYHAAADALRIQVRKQLQKTLPEDEYAALKGNMWAFRKRPAELTRKERRVLKQLFAHAPDLKQAYDFRVQLTRIFDRNLSRSEARKQIRSWMTRVRKSGLTGFDMFLNTLTNWFDEITNYFINRLSSGFVEGFNNKVKVLKRRCYGILNPRHLFQRLWLDLNGYRLFV